MVASIQRPRLQGKLAAMTPRKLLVVLLALALGGCAQLPQRPDLPVEVAVPEGIGSPLDAWIAGSEQAHAGQSAFRLLSKGTESFVTRVKSANAATRSIDVQTYIWHGDTTGMHLAERLLAAADRGVKVRLLVDDMDARAANAGFAALAAHENIEVRMYNPFASREGKVVDDARGAGQFQPHQSPHAQQELDRGQPHGTGGRAQPGR